MTEYHDHRDDCPFKFATLDMCDCVEKNMLDRIEALTEQLAAARQDAKEAEAYAEELEKDRDALDAKLAEFRHALLWCGGSADFNEGGVAREGWLKVCAPLLKAESHD